MQPRRFFCVRNKRIIAENKQSCILYTALLASKSSVVVTCSRPHACTGNDLSVSDIAVEVTLQLVHHLQMTTVASGNLQFPTLKD